MNASNIHPQISLILLNVDSFYNLCNIFVYAQVFWVGRNLEDIQLVIRRITPLMVEVLGSPFQKLKNVIL